MQKLYIYLISFLVPFLIHSMERNITITNSESKYKYTENKEEIKLPNQDIPSVNAISNTATNEPNEQISLVPNRPKRNCFKLCIKTCLLTTCCCSMALLIGAGLAWASNGFVLLKF